MKHALYTPSVVGITRISLQTDVFRSSWRETARNLPNCERLTEGLEGWEGSRLGRPLLPRRSAPGAPPQCGRGLPHVTTGNHCPSHMSASRAVGRALREVESFPWKSHLVLRLMKCYSREWLSGPACGLLLPLPCLQGTLYSHSNFVPLLGFTGCPWEHYALGGKFWLCCQTELGSNPKLCYLLLTQQGVAVNEIVTRY